VSDETLTEITLNTRMVQLRAELVCDHWRKAALAWGDAPMPGRITAHSLGCVLAALRGESDPAQLGVSPDSEEWALLTSLQPEEGESGT